MSQVATPFFNFFLFFRTARPQKQLGSRCCSFLREGGLTIRAVRSKGLVLFAKCKLLYERSLKNQCPGASFWSHSLVSHRGGTNVCFFPCRYFSAFSFFLGRVVLENIEQVEKWRPKKNERWCHPCVRPGSGSKRRRQDIDF